MRIHAYLFLKNVGKSLESSDCQKSELGSAAATPVCSFLVLKSCSTLWLHHIFAPHAAQQHLNLTPSCTHISPFSPIHPLVRLSAQLILMNFPFLPFLSYTPMPFAFLVFRIMHSYLSSQRSFMAAAIDIS